MKIKKYILPIFILIILIGFLGPIMVAHGFDPSNSFPNNPNDPNFVGQPTTTTSSGSSFLACYLGSNPKFQNLLGYITCIINMSVIPLIFALAVVMFVWGVVQFVINSDEEAKKAKGKQFMIWGIIALAVMVSVWGLVSILGNTFGIKTIIPQVAVPKSP
jgi:Na+/proline symporter